MNKEEKNKLQDLIVKQTEEIYKLRSELQEKEFQINALRKENEELVSYLDQASSPTPIEGTLKCRSIENEEQMKIKFEGTATMAPYFFYHKRGIKMPDWAKQCCQMYRSKRKAK